jgi:hypothetical protein
MKKWMCRILLVIAVVFQGAIVSAQTNGLPRSSGLVQTQTRKAGTGTHKDGATARQLIDSALNAMGGEEKLRAIKSLKIVRQGYLNLIEQSERPEGPYIPALEHTTELWDLSGERYSSETASSVTSDFDFSSKIIVANGIAGRGFGQQMGPGSKAEIQQTEEWVELSPFRVLLNAIDSSDLHTEGDTVTQGVTNHVVAFTWRSHPVRLLLNQHTSLPTVIELVNAYPYDVFWNVWGDVKTRVYLSFWELGAGGMQYPRQLDIERNGMPLRTTMIDTIAINPPLADDAFTLPENVRADFEKRKDRTIEQTPLGIPNRPAKELGEGVVYIPGSWGISIVKQSDGLVIIEAPISAGYSAQVIDEAKRRFPNLPIKAVITTSDAWPHFGGVREYVARGVPIYALDLNVSILNRMLKSSRRLTPDALERKPRRPDFRVVSAKTMLGDGANRMELYPVRTETGERMIMIYFPQHHLLYASDLIQPARGGLFNAQYAFEAAQAVKREGLTVENIYAMHTNLSPWSKVSESIERTTNPAATAGNK